MTFEACREMKHKGLGSFRHTEIWGGEGMWLETTYGLCAWSMIWEGPNKEVIKTLCLKSRCGGTYL